MQPTFVSDLFTQWQQEDRQLKERIADTRAWMREVDQWGIPYFGEASGRLRGLRDRLRQHFDREDEIIGALADQIQGQLSPVDRLKDESESDHQRLSDQLEDLIDRLNQLEPPFKSWTAAMNEIDSFLNGLQAHERKESSELASLLIAGESHI